MTMPATPDVLEWIRQRLLGTPLAPEVEPILRQARQAYGGETVYIRTPEPSKVSRRTVQRRLRVTSL